MPMIDVVWWNYNPKAIARGYWDNELPERILRGQRHSEWKINAWREWGARHSIAVFVVPGQHNAGNVDVLNEHMGEFEGVLLMVTGDEEGLFPWSLVSHPNIRTWAFAPNSPGAFEADRLLPWGPTPHGFTDLPKTLDWFFAGQINTPERAEMARTLMELEGGKLLGSEGFARGMSTEEYVTVMNRARVVPCPPAWKHPDTFRVWEALDAGAVPLIDVFDPYWKRLWYPDGIPFTSYGTEIWNEINNGLHWSLKYADFDATRYKAWWLQHQHQYKRWLWEDVAALGGPDLRPKITTIIPTSPIPSHPSVSIINETINSVSSRLDGPIIVMCDGVRPELEHRRHDYEAYLRELVRLPGIIPVLFDEHVHQGVMTRTVLRDWVDSDYVLFVEHDTPLTGSIPWDDLIDNMADDSGCSPDLCRDYGRGADVIRLYPEPRLEPEHHYLMGRRDGDFTWTTQWSQRPHLARTDYYRHLMDTYFGWESRTMIEDVMHGVADNNPADHRILIYTPDGNIQRSKHLDGRGEDSKFEEAFRFEYDGEVPPGAPYPSSLRS